MSKVPKDAKLVYDGIRIKVFQWEQEQYDGSYKTFEVSFKRPGIELIIVNKENKIILAHEEQPYVGEYINLPGGCIENGASPLETAKKELLEEFGLVSENISLFAKFETGNSIITTTFVYLVKDIRKVSEPNLDVGEKITPLEVDFEEFLKLTQNDEFRDKVFQQTIGKLNSQEKEIMKNKIFGIEQTQLNF